jgi:energy-coupling factor transporter ATP-binding protein EcfA2
MASPESYYQTRHDTIARELDALEAVIARIAYGRLAAFLTAVALATAAVWWVPPGARPWLFAGSVGLLFAFGALVVRHSRVEERRDHARARLAFARDALLAIRRDWAALPVPPAAVSEHHPYAVDLDLAGDASLFQLVDRGATPLGRRRLQEWLLAPASLELIRDRQAAVAALAADASLREDLVAWARLLDDAPADLARFLEWAEGEPWLRPRRTLVWMVRALTVASIVAVVLAAFGRVTGVWPFTTGVAGLLTWFWRRPIAETFSRAANSGVAIRRYARLFERVRGIGISTPLVDRVRAAFESNGVHASDALHVFWRIADRSNLRYSVAIFYAAIQVVTLWDFHVVDALESWQRRHGRHVRGWLHALADLEALVALGGLRHDNPSFTFPQLDDATPPIVAARGIGHPLIAEASRVVNDVSLGPPGTFLLVTGSNMSGKSTLLRAIGLNAVLAQAGAPVCAASLRMAPVRVHTSMRVHDSLAQGVSSFMAALMRLKTVVDASRSKEGAPLVYLLDEILQGTNSAERQIAVRRIVGHLLHQHAIGAVTTHDLDIAATEPLASAAQLVHFSEAFRVEGGREVMVFDYTLRPGVATSRNALKLMEIIGVTPDDAAPAARKT